ncbi:hypothetical protein P170DRAFT_451196 [Aspergillus steynii IBT 23096]|uniref:Peptidase S9 prolyl oligopeptidase catalytic domain-containing protein n=1 Tax=Aspergillus steynii IBT 23096 TaxID=1392250 RepID=A0A2I2FR61_9EURO|nr:uncharacterized protein P170DRAFT_451196 [Aspergillus steynii IBT 23096]PLB43097.1 hypothetical protein P170DRAFT_451196 [Aspergillus steynii IBT 23096]
MLSKALPGQNAPEILYSEDWQVLGPFRCGTRESVWGADPLEIQGGFSTLPFNTSAAFDSALAPNGTAKWGLLTANTSGSSSERAKTKLVVTFPDIDWDHLASVYGWPGLQYQAWARGHLRLNSGSNQNIAIFTDGLLEISINGQRYFGGDLYSYHKIPLILSLPPGDNVIELRLVRDVRALGGIGEPMIEVAMEAQIRHDFLTVDEQSLIIPEMTDGTLASSWASADQLQITMGKPLYLSSYQTRPLIFQIRAGTIPTNEVSVEICFNVRKGGAQRITYLHPANIVSYAILRPPPEHLCHGHESLPVILGLHGAGLEADSMQVRQMLDDAYGVCAWMLFPSGVTSWSGDDWHEWGSSDIKAAIDAVPQWIRNLHWEGPNLSHANWVVTGHSNGGQGAWHLATHYPDNVIALAPVSGYSSIENYVPYTMWQESEPLLFSVLQRSRSSYRHELLLSNIAGIPVLQQHGAIDDNVPVYHSRLMHQLLGQEHWPSEYEELAGKNHWYEGVMTTPALLRFYDEHTHAESNPMIPSSFKVTIPSSGYISSKGGITVDQLRSPDVNGHIEVTRDTDKGVWYLETRNIHRFHISGNVDRIELPTSLVLDGANHDLEVNAGRYKNASFFRDARGKWKLSQDQTWKSLAQRYGRQRGAMDAILYSEGPFTIGSCSPGIGHIALQVSRNLLQYFGADSFLRNPCNGNVSRAIPKDRKWLDGNVLTLALGNDLPHAELKGFPITVGEGKLVLSKRALVNLGPEQHDVFGGDQNCVDFRYEFEAGMGALFLRPLENERLELVVWGADITGLEQAARLVPSLTGVGQPDFIILSDTCRWKGHAGVYAAGHFDKFWQVSSGSFISADPQPH